MYSLDYYIIYKALSIGFLQILIGLFARSEKLAACNLVRIQRSDTASHDAKNFYEAFHLIRQQLGWMILPKQNLHCRFSLQS